MRFRWWKELQDVYWHSLDWIVINSLETRAEAAENDLAELLEKRLRLFRDDVASIV